MSYIPYNLPSIGQEEIDEVAKVLRSGWITTGPVTTQFEKEFAEYVRAPHALAVNSCTAGLHLALAALGIGPGDEVITTPLTFCATVNVILHVGATPVLADVGPDGNIDPESIASRITERTRAILPVHLAGLPCDMDAIWSLARQHGLYVVEDAAHAVGTQYKGTPIGGGNPEAGYASDAVVFSFYATKNLTTGEGGMITTHNQELLERMRILCLHGISKDAWNRYTEKGSWYYEVVDIGFKYNLSDIQSAIGIHQLRKQDKFKEIRTEYAVRYNGLFAGCEEFETPGLSPDHCWHLYVLQLRLEKLAIDRAQVIQELRSKGIGTSVHFIPIPLHPAFASWTQLPQNHCPRALELYPRLLSLPLYPSMTTEEVDRVAHTVRELLASSRRGPAVSFVSSH